MGLILVAALVLLLAGMGMGYKWAWMDAYDKGWHDARRQVKPVLDARDRAYRDWLVGGAKDPWPK